MLSFFKHSPYAPAPADEQIARLSGFGTAGEMLSLSFSLAASAAIANLELASSDLASATDSIPKSRVSLYIVKVWEQAGIGIYQSDAVRVPELLLKDDRAPFRDGYSRRGSCGHWKHLLRASHIYKPPDVRLEGDARTSLGCRESKQIWVSVKIPPDARAGLYDGHIEAKSGDQARVIKRLEFQIEVLPIKLLQPEQDLFFWYKGTLDCRSPQHYLAEEIFRAQLQDIYDHGFHSISLNEHDPEYLQQALDIADAVGFRRNVLLTASSPQQFAEIDFKQMKPIYYVSDKVDGGDEGFVRAHIKKWRMVKSAGGQTMSTLYRQPFARRLFDDNDIGCAPDIINYYLPTNLDYFLAYSEFQNLRERKTYYYWQTHMEKPDAHRVLAGLYLWKSKAHGIAPYCYQHLPQHPFLPFDDFDEWQPGYHVGTERRPFKDHMTTYPARSGSIPTLQWKGLTDGIYDLRYLITFEAALERAESCRSTESEPFINEARRRFAEFLKRISIKGISITSDTNAAPYQEIQTEEYANFREQLARDIVTLTDLTGACAGLDQE